MPNIYIFLILATDINTCRLLYNHTDADVNTNTDADTDANDDDDASQVSMS
jgi:hypothetical protein